jgi:hypothetical protein
MIMTNTFESPFKFSQRKSLNVVSPKMLANQKFRRSTKLPNINELRAHSQLEGGHTFSRFTTSDGLETKNVTAGRNSLAALTSNGRFS